jgi:uncharacterized damage-inducible protein DinB
MENSTQLAKRFREVLLEGKWIANTNYNATLSDVTWQQATAKIGAWNTIAALTYHINYYIAGILNVFEGGDLEIRDKYSFDLPEITAQEEWQRLRNKLFANAERFAQHVEKMSEEQLAASFVKEQYGNYRRNIEGVIEHSYYHLGQIVLIKKGLGTLIK